MHERAFGRESAKKGKLLAGYVSRALGHAHGFGHQEECLATTDTETICVMNCECTSGTCDTGARL
jgi:hypothetical protein